MAGAEARHLTEEIGTMRLTIDLNEDDLDELLYINVNFSICRRLLPIIKLVRPDLAKRYRLKWKDINGQYGKEKCPAFIFSADADIRYPGEGMQ